MTQIKSQFKPSDETLREAEAKFKQGKFAEAEPMFLLALVLLERNLPEDHPEVLGCMEKLGDTFYASEKFKDAAPVYKRLVGIREKSLGSHQLTISGLFKLAKTCERLSQPDEAESNYKHAVELGESISGPLYANLLDAYAGLLKRTGRDPQNAARLETLAKERRQRDAANSAQRPSASQAAIAAQSNTLQQAAAIVPGNGEQLTSAPVQPATPATPEPAVTPRTSTSQAPAQKPAEPVHSYKSEGLDAVKAPAEKPTQQGISESLTMRAAPPSFIKESETAKFDAIKIGADMLPPKPAASSPLFNKADLDSIKPPSESAPVVANKAELDAIKPAEEAPPGFDDDDLDAIGAPGETPSAGGFDKSVLDSIQPPSAASAPAFDKSVLDSIQPPSGSAPAFDKSVLDSIKPPSASASAFDKDTLESIKAPGGGAPVVDKSVLDSIKPPGGSAPVFDKSVLDSIKPPSVSAPAPEKTVDAGKPAETPARGTAGGAGLSSRFAAAKGADTEGGKEKEPAYAMEELDALRPSGPWKGSDKKGPRANISKIRGGGSLLDAQAIVAGIVIFLLIAAVGWLVYSSLTHPTKKTNNEVSEYVNKTFKTADDKQWLTFSDNFHGHAYIKKYKDPKRQKFDVNIDVYNGGPADQLGVLTNQYDNDLWLLASPAGLKAESGALFYAPEGDESGVVRQMWQVADAAQAYYNKHGRYPRHAAKDPFHLKELNPHLSFVNPVTKNEMPPEISTFDLPSSETPRIGEKTEMERNWANGQPFRESARSGPGVIRCAQLGWPKLDAALIEDYSKFGSQTYDCFFVEAYGADGQLLRGADGKVFMISLKKGVDYTPATSTPLIPDKAKMPVTLAISTANDRPTTVSIVLKYVAIIAALVLAIVLFSKRDSIRLWLRRGQ